MNKVIVYVHCGMVECENAPDNVIVELHDYDIREIEENNPDREYGHNLLGDYEISQLHMPHDTPPDPQHGREPDKVKLTCGDCEDFKLVSKGGLKPSLNCAVVGYGTRASNNPCDRFKPKRNRLG